VSLLFLAVLLFPLVPFVLTLAFVLLVFLLLQTFNDLSAQRILCMCILF